VTTLIAGDGTFQKRARGSTPGAFSPSRALRDLWALQRDRWILWAPVGVIAGAALWLTAPATPPIWIGGALAALGAACAAGLLSWPSDSVSGWRVALRRLLAGLCALAASVGVGMAAAQWRAAAAATPSFPALDAPIMVEGWVSSIDSSDAGQRLRLLVRHIEGVEGPPRYVRVSVPAAGLLTPGRAARCRAVLGPPAGPLAPGAYDFARRAWFERLGATGFGFGRCRPAAFAPPDDWLDRHRLWLAAARYDLSGAIQRAAPGRGGTIAAALVTGDRSPIDQQTNEALRDSGLGHLLSVSGIHMGVVGGLVFAMLLWTLSLIGPIALRWPVKKLAAIGALAALLAYLIVSGSSVPALRAFVMACVAFGAILLDRPAISMRGLALAALIVTLILPEAVIEPGFQMSFAATMALVALFEMMRRAPHEPALPTPGPLIGALQASVRGIGGVILISLVAGLATDPFAIYHFQRFSVYSLPANLIAAPIMSFLVAPAAAAAAILAPFGMSGPALELMASALDLIAAIGATFGGRPEALRALPMPPDLAFLLCVFAMLWACLWRGALRWLALAPFAASLAIYVNAPRPIAAFDADLRAVYVRTEAAGEPWRLITGRGRSTYARDRLGGMLGLSIPRIERLSSPETCAESLCVMQTQAGALMLVRRQEGFAAACAPGALVISAHDAPSGYAARCNIHLLDRLALTNGGGAFVYAADPAGFAIKRARQSAVDRPWTTRITLDSAN
jgi:competence protein ComEC